MIDQKVIVALDYDNQADALALIQAQHTLQHR